MKLILFILIFSHFTLISSEKKGKSPSKAMLYSIIPGGGQVYNEDYWKAPIMFAGAGIMIGTALYYHGLANDVEKMIESEQNGGLNLNQLKRKREFYVDNRDQFYFYFAGIYIISLLDAYTGAHLYDFDIDEDTSLNFGIIDKNKVGISLTIRLFNK